MSLGMKLSFYISDDGKGEQPSIGHLREFLKVADAHGVHDADELVPERDESGDIEGFYVYLTPTAELLGRE